MVMVALSLVVLLGMLALVLDLGGLVAKRRALVQGADAAALAAAQSCGRKEGAPAAVTQADQYAAANEAVATQLQPPEFDPDCDAASGQVTVRYQGEYRLFVAPVLGVDPTGRVTASATAMWGGAAQANVVPFMLNADRLSDCNIPDEVEVGQICRFAFDMDSIGNAQWGRMNLAEWDVAADANCTSAGTAEMIDWIQNGYHVELNSEGPTYVCRDTGEAVPVFRELDKLAGQVRDFPINEPGNRPTTLPGRGQVDKDGNLCPPDCSPHKYDILGFAEMKILRVLRGNQGGSEVCEGLPSSPNSWCLEAQWLGWKATSEDPGGENFGIVAVQLTE